MSVLFFSETPLSKRSTQLILFTDIESPKWPIYSGVTFTTPSIYTYTVCFTKKYTQSSKLILKSLADDTF